MKNLKKNAQKKLVFLFLILFGFFSFPITLAWSFCPPNHISKPIKDWREPDYFGREWLRPIIISEFAVSGSPIKNKCAEDGYITENGDGKFEKTPIVYFWYRLQGNRKFEDLQLSDNQLRISLVNEKTGEEYPIPRRKANSQINIPAVIEEIDGNESEARHAKGDQVSFRDQFFDWRDNFQSKNIAPGIWRIRILYNGFPIQCRRERISTCNCTDQFDASCGIKIELISGENGNE